MPFAWCAYRVRFVPNNGSIDDDVGRFDPAFDSHQVPPERTFEGAGAGGDWF